MNVSRLDLGFRIDHVVTFGLSPDLNGYSVDRTRLFFQRLERRPSGSAGRDGGDDVERAASVGDQPVKGCCLIRVQGRTRHGQRLPLQQSRSRLLLRARHSAHCRTRVPAMPTRRIPRRLPSSTRHSQRSSASATTPSASRWDKNLRGLPQQTRHDDRRSRRGREAIAK